MTKPPIFICKNISSNTGGTESPRVFWKKAETHKELLQWLERLPHKGSRFMEWGDHLHSFILSHMGQYKTSTYEGAGSTKVEKFYSNSMEYFHVVGIEGKTFLVKNEGALDFWDIELLQNTQIFLQHGTLRSPEWKKIAEGICYLFYASHEGSGRYVDYYIILGKQKDAPSWIPRDAHHLWKELSIELGYIPKEPKHEFGSLKKVEFEVEEVSYRKGEFLCDFYLYDDKGNDFHCRTWNIGYEWKTAEENFEFLINYISEEMWDSEKIKKKFSEAERKLIYEEVKDFLLSHSRRDD